MCLLSSVCRSVQSNSECMCENPDKALIITAEQGHINEVLFWISFFSIKDMNILSLIQPQLKI